MKRIILFLFIFFLYQKSSLFAQTNRDLIHSKVLASAAVKVKSLNTEKIELEYTFLAPKIERTDERYYSVEMEDTQKYYDEPGLPLLPFKTVKVRIPKGRDVKNIDIIAGKKIVIDGEFKIEYSKKQLPISRPELTVETEPNQEVYNSRSPFPGKLYSRVSTQYQRGSKILILNLYPVQYIPLLCKVFFYAKIKVIVTTMPKK